MASARKGHDEIARDILAKFDVADVSFAATPDINVASVVAIGHALLSIKGELVGIRNEISATRAALQALRR